MRTKSSSLTKKANRSLPVYAYDPRLVKVEDTYLHHLVPGLLRCSHRNGKTKILKPYVWRIHSFHSNRNAVLFPRKINGNFRMLSRPSDSGHTRSVTSSCPSPDMLYWGKHRHVMSKSPEWWESLKIGGAQSIETNEGWLLFYHGVSGTRNGYVYSIGGAILECRIRPSQIPLLPELPFRKSEGRREVSV